MQTDEILRISPYRDGFITCRKAFANFSREPENRVQKVLYGASLAGSLILLAGTENSANGISWLILVIGSK